MVNKKSPAKVKYDQRNPPVSFRLSKEVKDSLESHTTARGISLTDFLKEALAGKEQGSSYEDSYEDGHRDGFLEGWDCAQEYEGQQNEEAAECYFTCGVCGHRCILTRTIIKRVTLVKSAIIECPFCHTEHHRHFYDNPGLEQLCKPELR